MRKLLFAIPAILFGTMAAAASYTITDLGDLPGGSDFSIATGINASGQVVGYSDTSTGPRAFLWDAASGMTDLGTLPGGYHSYAHGINDSG